VDWKRLAALRCSMKAIKSLDIHPMAPEENMLIRFLKDERGQDIVEYSLLLVLIGSTAVFVLTAMGGSITNIFNKINTRLQSADAKVS
jgi:pilus assembly protein Flp/PilA